MKKAWSKRFFSEVLSILPFEKGVIVGTTFGATYINLEGKKELSWRFDRGVSCGCFLDRELVLGTSFPGSLIFFEGTRASRVLRTKGSVNWVLDFEGSIIAGTGFLKKVFTEGKYLSKYVHFKENWEEHREDIGGMVYRVNKNCEIMWKASVDGIVAKLILLRSGKLLAHAIYDKLIILDPGEGNILKELELGEPIRKVTYLPTNKEIYALTTRSLIRINEELNEMERSEGEEISSIASYNSKLAMAKKSGEILLNGREENVSGVPRDIILDHRGVFGVLKREGDYFFFSFAPCYWEFKIKGDPVDIKVFERNSYVATRGRVYAFSI